MASSLPRLFDDVVSLPRGKRSAREPALTLTQLGDAIKTAPLCLRALLPSKHDALRNRVTDCGDYYGFRAALGDEPTQRSHGGSRHSDKHQQYTLDIVIEVAWGALTQRVDDWLATSLHDLRISGSGRARASTNWGSCHGLSSQDWSDASCWIISGLRQAETWLEPCSIDDCASLVLDEVACCIGLAIDADMVKQLLAPLCIGVAEPSPFCARTLMRCRAMEPILGKVRWSKEPGLARTHVFLWKGSFSTIGNPSR